MTSLTRLLTILTQGRRICYVRVVLKEPIWHRHFNQLQPPYISDSDNGIEDVPSTSDAVQELTIESFTLKEKSLPSLSRQKNLHCCFLLMLAVLVLCPPIHRKECSLVLNLVFGRTFYLVRKVLYLFTLEWNLDAFYYSFKRANIT